MTRVEQAAAALELLAAPAAEQIRRLSNFFDKDLYTCPQHNIDEIALEYEDIAIAATDMYESGEITQEQKIRLMQLNNLLRSLSDTEPSEFWTVNGLAKDQKWDQVRREASDCLRLLDPWRFRKPKLLVLR